MTLIPCITLVALALLLSAACLAAPTDAGASREAPSQPRNGPSPWRPHTVRQQNGDASPISLRTRSQIVTENWNRVVAVPYLVYMPEKKRLLMLVSCDYPHRPMLAHSDDQGATWSAPRYFRKGDPGDSSAGHVVGTSLTYLGGGKLLLSEGGGQRWFSIDYGETWEGTTSVEKAPGGSPWYEWDPYLVDKDPKTGRVTRVAETGYSATMDTPSGGHAQAYIRFSGDEGRTWGEATTVPQWKGFNEVALARARNGDLLAACRSEVPEKYQQEIDHYEGLGTSFSTDNGRTWSRVNMLYAWGRHHPSMVTMPNGDVVMTYVVRKGYTDAPDGYQRFGIEAILSHDNGRTWDLDHRYVLAMWSSNRKVSNRWWASSQATSTVLLPDGALLTAFGTGYRSHPDAKGMSAPRDVGLVRWRLSRKPLNAERTIRDAPCDSETRNVFDPVLMVSLPQALEKRLVCRKLRTLFNSDDSNIPSALDGKTATPADYRNVLHCLLDFGPGVVAQNVGMPDFVNYRSKVATLISKHMGATSTEDTMGRYMHVVDRMIQAGTDVLQLTTETCHERGVPVVASYRMNSEDWYDKTYALSDIGRAHPEWRIPGAGCLDPAVPEVYAYRMSIFREAAENYNIDGLEFDFRRWYHMVSNPEKNHLVLTRMVRATRKMLGEVARRKGRKKLLLGVRVGPSLDTPPNPFVYPGEYYPKDLENSSCRALGIDVKTWIKEGLVDYVCPATFIGPLPALPLTREFADLAKGTEVGIYPTLWAKSGWMHGVGERWVSLAKEDEKALALYKYDLCTTALRMYQEGADGISTFNWFSHLRDAKVPHNWASRENAPGGQVDGGFTDEGSDAVQSYIYPLLGDPKAVAEYLRQPWALSPAR